MREVLKKILGTEDDFQVQLRLLYDSGCAHARQAGVLVGNVCWELFCLFWLKMQWFLKLAMQRGARAGFVIIVLGLVKHFDAVPWDRISVSRWTVVRTLEQALREQLHVLQGKPVSCPLNILNLTHLSNDLTDRRLKSTYRDMAKIWHPDLRRTELQKECAWRMRMVNGAKDELQKLLDGKTPLGQEHCCNLNDALWTCYSSSAFAPWLRAWCEHADVCQVELMQEAYRFALLCALAIIVALVLTDCLRIVMKILYWPLHYTISFLYEVLWVRFLSWPVCKAIKFIRFCLYFMYQHSALFWPGKCAVYMICWCLRPASTRQPAPEAEPGPGQRLVSRMRQIWSAFRWQGEATESDEQSRVHARARPRALKVH
jgi:hypothetical protein